MMQENIHLNVIIIVIIFGGFSFILPLIFISIRDREDLLQSELILSHPLKSRIILYKNVLQGCAKCTGNMYEKGLLLRDEESGGGLCNYYSSFTTDSKSHFI